MPSLESFASVLRNYRKNNGLSQEELGRQLDFSTETISAWERGKRKPHPLQIARLARLIGKDVQELTQSIYPDSPLVDEFKRQEHPAPLSQEIDSVTIYSSQDECEPLIRQESRHATRIKVLTIRGEKYFLGPKSLLHNLLYSSRHVKDSNIKVLVLSPNSSHITEELAIKLGHENVERVRGKMDSVLGYLKFLMSEYKNFEVRCYQENPIFKILMFDEVMFVSSFVGGGPKNDRNVRMFRLTREGNPIFLGLEGFFDLLWSRSAIPL